MATESRGSRFAQRGDIRRVIRRLYDFPQRSAIAPDDVAMLSDLYDEEIAYLDDRLSELMDRLQRDGRLEDTIVVLLADHGEELYDHGEWGHCRDIAFESVFHTPLVFWIPGGPHGVVRAGLAGDLDVVPTLLDLLRIPYDAKAFDGASLRGTIETGAPPAASIAFSMQGTNRVATDGRFKVWLDLAGGAPRVFDLRVGERAPATDFDRPAINRLAAALRAWIEREESGGSSDSVRRARETEAQLKALGYL
jgi:hypothetical protein